MPFDFEDDYSLAGKLKGPVVSVCARIRVGDFAAKSNPHRFGGALSLDIRGTAVDAPALHRVLTLALGDPLLGFSIEGMTVLPLVYGFVYDGCRLKYRLVDDGRIEVLQIHPRSPTAEWPYPRYPAAFRERRFGLRDDGTIEPDQVHALTWQHVEGMDPAKGVVIIVPPSEDYGVSLWGEDGDAERVQVIFEVDPAARTVAAYNQCS